jgi:enediyne polyketide synthase
VAAGRALGRLAEVRYRPDGRPEIDGGPDGGIAISASHGPGITLCVAAADGPVGCDVERVTERPGGTWDELLGAHAPLAGLLATETAEGRDAAATRVWAAIECLQKAGLPPGSPLTLTAAGRDGWTVLASGGLRIVTLVTTLRDVPEQVVFAVLTSGRP